MNTLQDLEDVKLASLSDLEAFFREKNIPQEKTRFFVNQNLSEPKCFGIYQDVDTGNFIVYKNKSDGSRTVRYEGTDEKLAVSIFFDKLKQEMAIRDNQGLYKSSIDQIKEKNLAKRNRTNRFIVIFVIMWVMAFAAVPIYFGIKSLFTPKTGYYNYNDSYYYYGHNNWWYYDDFYDDWYIYDGYINDYKDYYTGSYYDDSYGYSNIYYSDEYESYEQSHSSSSDSYDYSSDDFDSYDFDSWDSSSTNWDSDW